MIQEITLTVEPITIPALILPTREIGAVVEFLGIVREREGEAHLTGLFYEAYEQMALEQFSRIFGELEAKFPVEAVQIVHRLGWIPVGEPSLFIRVQASHRAEAFHFCHQAIDRMKEDVPIWKRATN